MPRKPSGNFDQYQYDQNYIKQNLIRIAVVFNKLNPEDMRCVDYLKKHKSMSAYIKELIAKDMKGAGTMKKSELIKKCYTEIKAEMIDRYETVLKCGGRVQYKIYVWSDGELEVLEQPQGDHSYLAPRDAEPRELVYVTTVAMPYYNPWDCADHSAPDDDAEREAEEAELIEYEMEAYRGNVESVLDDIIDDAEREERYEE